MIRLPITRGPQHEPCPRERGNYAERLNGLPPRGRLVNPRKRFLIRRESVWRGGA